MPINPGTPTFDGSGATTATSVAIPLPGAVGEWCQIEVSANGGTGIVLPTGWIQQARSTTIVTNPRFLACGKILTADDVGSTLTVSLGSTAVAWSWYAQPHSGIDLTTPQDTTPGQTENATTSTVNHVAPTVPAGTPGRTLIGGAAGNTGTTVSWTPPTGWTETLDPSQLPASSKNLTAAHLVDQDGTAATSPTFVLASGRAGIAWSGSLRPAVTTETGTGSGGITTTSTLAAAGRPSAALAGAIGTASSLAAAGRPSAAAVGAISTSSSLVASAPIQESGSGAIATTTTLFGGSPAQEAAREQATNGDVATLNYISYSPGLSGGTGTLTREAAGGPTGGAFSRITWTAAQTTMATAGQLYSISGALIDPGMAAQPGQVHRGAAWVRSSRTQRILFYLQHLNSAGATLASTFRAYVAPTGEWMRVTHESAPAPAGTVRVRLLAYQASSGEAATLYQAGDTLDVTGWSLAENAGIPATSGAGSIGTTSTLQATGGQTAARAGAITTASTLAVTGRAHTARTAAITTGSTLAGSGLPAAMPSLAAIATTTTLNAAGMPALGIIATHYQMLPAAPALPGRATRWRYIAQNILTGAFVHWNVPITAEDGPRWDLSGPGSLRGVLNPVREDLRGPDGELLLQEWQTAIYAEANGRIRWGGLLTRVSFDGPAATLELAGFSTYPHGQDYDGPLYSHLQIDPTQVFADIWAHLQAQPDGNLGVVIRRPTNCPVRLGRPAIPARPGVDAEPAEPYVLAWWENVDMGGEADQVAAETPFDYRERHHWNAAGGIDHEIEIGWPRLGRKQDHLSFRQGVNITQVVVANRNGDEYANTVRGLGKGEGAKMARVTVAIRDGRLRRTTTWVDKSTSSRDRLTAATRAEMERRKLTVAFDSITVRDHENAPLGSFEEGDDIKVCVTLDWLGYVEVWHRITSWAMVGEDSAVLTLRRSDSFTYAPANVSA